MLSQSEAKMSEKKQLDAASVLAKTAWGEARGETDLNSPLGVIFSILNRQKGHKSGKTLWSIVNEPNQYAAWHASDPNRDDIRSFGPGHPMWEQYYTMARQALEGAIPDPTHGAEWYITEALHLKNPPGWIKNLEQTSKHGSHVFFRKKAKK